MTFIGYYLGDDTKIPLDGIYRSGLPCSDIYMKIFVSGSLTRNIGRRLCL